MTRVRGFPVSPGSYSGIEKAARRLRGVLSIDPLGYLPGLRLFESLDRYHVTVDGKNMSVSYDVRALTAEAQTEYDRERNEVVVVLSESTYDLLRREMVRARFTLAHELGHLCFHSALAVKLSTIPHQQVALMRSQAPKHSVCCDSEWQANAFAAAILMPARGLKLLEDEHGADALFHVAADYGVSNESASYRWETYQKRKGTLLR